MGGKGSPGYGGKQGLSIFLEMSFGLTYLYTSYSFTNNGSIVNERLLV